MDSCNSTLALFILLTISSTSVAQNPFRCTSTGATCNALVDYVSPNATTLFEIRTLFSIRHLRRLLGANNFNLTTPGSYPIPANQPVRIPFPCICTNGTGISNRTPTYTVVAGDGLYHIAAEVFSNLVSFPEIQAVNNIPDANLIEVGQSLWIPLPCSCDEVDGLSVLHYGHSVQQGSSIEGIAQRYNTSGDTLMRLNGLANSSELLAGAILDVPLRACSSMVTNNSRDYPLLVANGTYVFTANDCVQCRCDASMNWMLQCEPTQFNSSCPRSSVQCSGAPNFYIGNMTSSGCNTTTCAYSGYNSSIMTTLASQSTCPAPTPNGGSSAFRLQHQNKLLFVLYAMLLIVAFLN